MGIIEDAVAKSLTEIWKMLPVDKKNQIKEGTVAGEKGLEIFNKVISDDNVDPVELESAIKMILEAMGSTTGRAFQAFLWSLFK
jgi:hypothetical protein